MFYSIRHVTRYRYDAPVRESVMQLYKQPKSDGAQRLQAFQVTTHPRATLQAYTDYLGNAVYHFDVPGAHNELVVEIEAAVEVHAQPAPPEWVDSSAWQVLGSSDVQAENFDMLRPHGLTQPSEALRDFLDERNLIKADDPMTSLRRLNRTIFDAFTYVQDETEVDSPIDVALKKRKGVCQDFAHIMLVVARGWGIPARYVSGYLYTKRDGGDRSAPDATHAWIEALVPGAGWVGFDPTNNVLAGERHIRVAIGRDYNDVPPARGVFKGPANSELAVAVTVTPAQAPRRRDDFLRVVRPMPKRAERPAAPSVHAQQQQQQ
ncbi:MAG: transglutaminase family protein [Alphaproteobacteria bacterium]|nr:transglutaminase family protein [Alphaproteobacteria bacterium]